MNALLESLTKSLTEQGWKVEMQENNQIPAEIARRYDSLPTDYIYILRNNYKKCRTSLGAEDPGFESPHSDHISQKSRLKRRLSCVFVLFLRFRRLLFSDGFRSRKSGGSMSKDSGRNR